MSTEIQFQSLAYINKSLNEAECIEMDPRFDIESIIDGFYDFADSNSIQCVDDIMETIHKYFVPLGLE